MEKNNILTFRPALTPQKNITVNNNLNELQSFSGSDGEVKNSIADTGK
jgi:hypothetical protein